MQSSHEEASSGLAAIRLAAGRALRRFPGVLIVATLASVVFIHGLLTDRLGAESPHWMLLIPCILGISWLYSLSLIAERRWKGRWKTLGPLLIGAATLALYYWRIRTFPPSSHPLSFILEIAGLAVALHLFAAYAPFLGYRQPRAFWEYNRRIFLRFLLGLLFSGTLMLGITLFLVVLRSILAKFPLEILQIVLSVLLVGVFNTWFFLAGVPEDFDGLEAAPQPYPRALKFFAQFVLLPLILIIGASLALWMLIKLSGGFSLQATGVSAFLTLGGFGLLTYLLLYPLEEDARQRWLKIYRRGFFLALFPFLAIFAIQAFGLVQKFGWTPPRYYGLIFLVWGAALCLYLVLSRRPHIAWIPVSLSLLALATVAGPWSAVPLTQASQKNRLAKMLGNPLPIDQARLRTLDPKRRTQLESQVGYVEESLGCEALQPYFGELLGSRHHEESPCSTMDVLRVLRRDPALPPEELEVEVVNINFLEQSSNEALNIRGYDLYFSSSAIQFLEAGQSSSDCNQYAGSPPLCVRRGTESYRIEVFRQGRRLGDIDLEPMVQALLKKHASEKIKAGEDAHYRTFDLPPSDMSFETRLGGRPARIDFEHLRLEQRGQRISPESVRFSLLFQERT